MGAREESGYVFRDRYPEREAVYRCFDEKSADARRDLECLLDVPYGSGERESFDLYLGAAGGPLIVFVHGGYWQSLSKDRYGFVASFLVKRGFNVALPNYPLVPEVPLDRVVDSVRRSVPAILGEMSRAGRTPPFWIASGHSAGGHLAAVLATTDWRSRGIGLPLAACVPISGLFDLEPLIGTSLNDKLRLDLETAVALSP